MIKFTRGPTVTKAVTLTVVFGIIHLASTSSLPSCSDPNFQSQAAASAINSLLGGNSSGPQCLTRQSYLYTWSGWLAVIFLIAAVILWVIKYGGTTVQHVMAYGQEQKKSGQAPPVSETMPEMGRTQPWQSPDDFPTRPDSSS